MRLHRSHMKTSVLEMFNLLWQTSAARAAICLKNKIQCYRCNLMYRKSCLRINKLKRHNYAWHCTSTKTKMLNMAKVKMVTMSSNWSELLAMIARKRSHLPIKLWQKSFLTVDLRLSWRRIWTRTLAWNWTKQALIKMICSSLLNSRQCLHCRIRTAEPNLNVNHSTTKIHTYLNTRRNRRTKSNNRSLVN